MAIYCSALLSSSQSYSPLIIPTNSASTNPRNKALQISCRSSTDQKWSISKQCDFMVKEKCWKEYEQKMEEVRGLLLQTNDDEESLVFVDAVQRAGVDHHFHEEIEMIIGRKYKEGNSGVLGDLRGVSLFFRLLRQQGHYVSADVFNNFKGKDGKFKENLRLDIMALLELYEAAQLSFQEESIMDEAEDFSRVNLSAYLEKMDEKWPKKVIRNTLRQPQHKSIARMTAKNYILGGCLKGSHGWEKALTELAKMDFLMGKSLHQEELRQISKWWKEVGVGEQLQRARNQPLKWYTWSMGSLLNDPNLSVQRIDLTKCITFIYLIDDIFDLYGTIQELTIFTEAINRWDDDAAIHMLPEYMRMSYKALVDTTNEIAHSVQHEHGYNPIDALKETWASLCDAFLVEGRWLDSCELPRAEEYLKNGRVSSGMHVVLVHLFFLLGLGGAKGGAIHLNDTSNLISSVAAILRLWDDLGSAKDEGQDGKDGSYIECYMRDKPKSSMEQARQHVEDMISKEWKNLNKEYCRLNHFSASYFKRASLNFARMVPLMYTYDENQRLPVLEEYVRSTLFH